MDKESETDIWKQWKTTGDKEFLGQLYKKYDGMIQLAVNKYVNPNIPRPALEGEAKNQAFIAFQTYDPKFGTQLSTHVGTRLHKLYSYTSKYQNIGKIPEGEISNINTYKQAKEQLRNDLKREPATTELADYLSWDIKRVSRMEASLRSDYMGLENVTAMESNPQFQKMMFTYYEMNPEEQLVFDYTIGAHGKPKMPPGQMAMEMGVSGSKVSAIKNKIAKRMQEYAIG